MKQETDILRVIIFEEELKDAKVFANQCLEKDIYVRGKNLEELFKCPKLPLGIGGRVEASLLLKGSISLNCVRKIDGLTEER